MYFFLPWYANSGLNGNQEAAEKDDLILGVCDNTS